MATQVIRSDSSIPSSRVWNAFLWLLQIGAAIMFIMAGAGKLAASEMQVATFQALGAGMWFMYFIGALEVTGALLILTRRFAFTGAMILLAVMFGAIMSHLLWIGGSALLAVSMAVVVLLIAYGRKDEVRGMF